MSQATPPKPSRPEQEVVPVLTDWQEAWGKLLTLHGHAHIAGQASGIIRKKLDAFAAMFADLRKKYEPPAGLADETEPKEK